MNNGNLSMSENDIQKLIYMYEQNPILFDCTHIEHRNRNKKNFILSNFATEIGVSG